MGAQVSTASQVNIVGSGLTTPPGGIRGIGVDTDGDLKQIDDQGAVTPLGGLSGVTTVAVNPVDEATALNAAITARAAAGGGIVWLPQGNHHFKGAINAASGVSLLGAGRGATSLVIDDSDGNIGDLIKLTNTFGVRLADFTITASSGRSAGKAIYVKGGDATKHLDSFNLSACEAVIERVDFNNQFDGVVIENNGSVANWLTYFRDSRGANFTGDGLRIDCPGVGDTYGASHFIERLFFYNNTVAEGGAGPVGASIHIKNSGDFNVIACETFGALNGLLMDPPAAAVTGGRLSTGRFRGCFFEAGAGADATGKIIPSGTAVFGDIDFEGCWFASGATHGMLINNSSLGTVPWDIRFRGCTFFRNTQYGMVLTGTDFCENIMVDSCAFSGNNSGGFRAVAAKHFAVRNSLFTQGHLPVGSGTQAVGIQVDAGCDFYIVTGNDTTDSTGTGFVDNGGAVTKIVTPNL